MTEIITFSIDEVVPERDAVFENQGIPAGTIVQEDIETLFGAALALLSELGAPTGALSEISISDFAYVYDGEGWNEPSTPVADIYPRADDLALFAVTLGQRIGQGIKEHFASNDYALACMLDSVASAAADKMAKVTENRFFQALSIRGQVTPATGVLGYSPGYCGWHMSGQKKLFEFLHPEAIDISLNDSYLMQPLKSVSGVIIAGPREIHDFQSSYLFCSRCETRGCRERIRALLAE
ncbi:MAG: vitamin B12 dependent-methionine synthase activation domain-containing protein [Phycisphaerae bacterium]